MSGIYLESTLVMGRSAENIEEKKKTDRRKALKSEEKEKRRIREKLKSNNIHLWFYKNTFLKKGVFNLYTIKTYKL